MHLRSKRKYSFEDFSQKKKIRLSKRRNTTNLEHVINLRIPHVGEQIFKSISNDTLIQCLKVSETWKVLVEPILAQRHKGKMNEACRAGKAEIVKLLLENYNPEENGLNATNSFNEFRPFTSACQQGHADVVKLLLEHSDGKIDLNAKSHGNTGFSWACTKGYKDIVKLLLTHSDGKIDLNAKDDVEQTAFLQACFFGRTDVVQLMLEHHEEIDFNAKDYKGWTGFIYACRHGCKDVVELILKHSKAKGIEIPTNIPGISKEIKNLVDFHQFDCDALQQAMSSFDSVHQKIVQLKRQIKKGKKKVKNREENFREMTKMADALVDEIDNYLYYLSESEEDNE